jgi:glutamate racemase
MAIGVFDSGVGGLSVHRHLVNRFPAADFLYLADQANAPYGVRGGEEIVELTKAGVRRLFDEGAGVVVLACNTASAVALRRLQQTWVRGVRAELGRPVNVLGVIVPTIEAATGLPWEHEAERRGEKIERLDIIGVFSTNATTSSRVYEIEIDKRRQDLAVFSEACTGLAGLIEEAAPRDQLAEVVDAHCKALKTRIGRWPDRVILGCTHYEIVADLFERALPPGTPIIKQPGAVADALERYFARHEEYDIGSGGLRRFLTTGPGGTQSGLVESFWGAPVTFEPA